MNCPKLLRTLVGLLLLGLTSVAHASVVYRFNLTQVGAFGSGPYGTVTLSERTGGVDFVVQLRSDLDFVNTGKDFEKAFFTFNAKDVATTDIDEIKFNGAADVRYKVYEAVGNAPFGKSFSLAIDCPNCPNGAPGKKEDPLSFYVRNASYGDFGFNLVTTTTTGGNKPKTTVDTTTAYFAADVICVDTSLSGTGGCNQNGATGAIGVPGPDMKVATLLALGLLGLVAARRRRASAT